MIKDTKKQPFEESSAAERQKILIVDDKEANLFALRDVLKDVDAEVFSADNGQAALARVLEHEFALIILDVRMPDMDGYEVAAHLQGDNTTKIIPIIFVTAEYPDEEHVFKGYEYGAIDYMLKPYSPKILLSKVDVLLKLDRNYKELKRSRHLLDETVQERTAKLKSSNDKLKRIADELKETNCAINEARLAALNMMEDAMQARVEIQRFADIQSAVAENLRAGITTQRSFFDRAVEKAIKLTQSQVGYIYFYDEDKQEFILNSWFNEMMPQCDVMDPQTCHELNKTGFWREAVRQRKPIMVNNYPAAHPLKKGTPDAHVTMKNFLTVPILQQEKIVAVISVANKPNHYTEQDIQSLDLFMNSLWKSLDNIKATQALKKSEEQYRTLFENMTSGFSLHEMIYNEQGAPCDYRFLQTNPAFEIITGFKNADIVGRTGKEMMPKTESIWIDTYARVVQTGESVEFERYSPEMKKYFHVRTFHTQENQFATVFEDISKRKQDEAELRRLSTAIEQSPEAVVITDPQGTIQYVNPAFEQITGYVQEEALGQTLRILKSGQHDEAFYADLWETISAGNTWKGRMINKRKDDSLFNEETTISPVKNPSGAITNYVSVKRDISAELVREEELLQAQKMDAVGQLAGGIAHDFNNILQGILSFSQLLEFSLDKNSQDYDNALEIQKAARRAAELTRQLLTFSRKHPVEYIDLDLNDCVREAEGLVNVLLGERFEVVLDLEENLPPIHADPGQMSQIIMNLAVNARDAMGDDGGRLSIVTEMGKLSDADAQRIPQARAGQFACLSITDTGCGMSAATRDRIFEPFFTTKPVGSGTGLGLSVIYGIIEQTKGWLNVYSEVGQGSCFKIYFPISFPNGKDEEHDKPSPDGQSAEILLVEDDPQIRTMTATILENANYRVHTAASGEEGMALFNEMEDGLDLLMADMELPGMRGDELALKLRVHNPGLPVLLLSGYHDKRTRWKSLTDSDYLFLHKPFSESHLMDCINSLLSKD